MRPMMYEELQAGDNLGIRKYRASASPDVRAWLPDDAITMFELVIVNPTPRREVILGPKRRHRVHDVHTLCDNGRPLARTCFVSLYIPESWSVHRDGTQIWPRTNTHG